MSDPHLTPSASYPATAPGRWLVLLVAAYAIFDLLPVWLRSDVGVHGLRVGDVIDAPLVLLPVAAYLALGDRTGVWRRTRWKVVGALLLVVLVQGHAIHLAANAIAASSLRDTPSWETTYFLDEHWGHVELHTAVILLSALMLVAAEDKLAPPSRDLPGRLVLGATAILYGLLLAADAIEGQTVPLMLPSSIFIVALALTLPRSQLLRVGRPTDTTVAAFFATAFAATCVALVAYGLVNSGYPELSFV